MEWRRGGRRGGPVIPVGATEVDDGQAARTARPLLAYLGSEAFVSGLRMVYVDVIDERRSECGNVRRENLPSGLTGVLPASLSQKRTHRATQGTQTPERSPRSMAKEGFRDGAVMRGYGFQAPPIGTRAREAQTGVQIPPIRMFAKSKVRGRRPGQQFCRNPNGEGKH